jgi:hypothetical protein
MQQLNKRLLILVFTIAFILIFPTISFAWDLDGGDHNGEDWIIDSNTTISGIHTNISRFEITEGVTVTVKNWNGTSFGSLEIHSYSTYINGVLNLQGKGYRGGSSGYGAGEGPGAGKTGGEWGGGGSYGGKGHTGNAQSGDIYGSEPQPDSMGSGSSAGKSGYGANGGGYFKLNTLNEVIINGTINANGQNAIVILDSGGGGSGGTIYIQADSISGNGSMSVKGGDNYQWSGAGGGGRIALYYNDYTFSGTIDYRGGLHNVALTRAQEGTIYFNTWGTTTGGDHDGKDWVISESIEITGIHTNVGHFQVNSGVTLKVKDYTQSPEYGILNIYCKSASIDGTINLNFTGFTGGRAYRSAGQGPGGGSTGGPWGGGASYGGLGESGNATRGPIYGEANNPIYRGSGGSGGNAGNGGNGGGALKIFSSGDMNINGSINSNGATSPSVIDTGGGGSGGSIYLIAHNLSGAGTLRVNGGDAYSWAGAGGGGRVAMYYSGLLNFTGTIERKLGSGAADNGTLFQGGYPKTPLYSELAQYKEDGITPINTGSTNNSSSVILKLLVSAGQTATLTPEFEIREVGTSLSGTTTHTGAPVSYSDTPIEAELQIDSLLNLTSYHWSSRVCDSLNNCSAWTSFGNNPESLADFTINLNTAPNIPTLLGPSEVTSGNFISSIYPTFTFELTDPDPNENLKFQILIDNDIDFLTPSVNYISDFSTESLRSFTVGQSTGSGIYLVGESGVGLLDGIYYWKVKAIDDDNESSLFTIANNSEIAFKVDTTKPTGSILINLGDMSTNNTNVSLLISASDNLSGISSMKICNQIDFIGCDWEMYNTSTNWSLSEGDGTKTVYVLFIDSNGNESDIHISSIILDTEGPTGNLTINDNDSSTSDINITLTLSSIDTYSEVAQMSLCNTSDFSGCSWEEYATTKEWVLTEGDGIKNVYIVFKDALGNISDVINSTIILDSTGPTGSIIINNGMNSTNNNVVQLQISASDQYSTVSNMIICNDDDFSTCEWEVYSTTINWLLTNGEGYKYIYYKFMDILGNYSETYSISILVDKSGPTANIKVNNGNKSTSNRTVTLSISSFDEYTKVKEMIICNVASFDGCKWENYLITKKWVLNNGNGNKNIYIKFRDIHQNESIVYTSSIILEVPTTIEDINEQEDNKALSEITQTELISILESIQEENNVGDNQEIIITSSNIQLVSTRDHKFHFYTDSDIELSIPVAMINDYSSSQVEKVYAVMGSNFTLLELNNDNSHYTGEISTKNILGKEKLYILTMFENGELNKNYIDVIINEYGLVYYSRDKEQIKIKDAKVTLYRVIDDEMKLYQVDNQKNPQVTDDQGKYYFIVEPGTYIIEVEAKGFSKYISNELKVVGSTIDNEIELYRDTRLKWILLVLFVSIPSSVFVIKWFGNK